MDRKKQQKRTQRKSVRHSEGRSVGSKYCPENIAVWLQQWKVDKEAWQFKSIANDEAIRICLNRDLMSKEDFDVFLQYFQTNKSSGAYKRLFQLCDEVEQQFVLNKMDEKIRNKMKRVVKVREILKDPNQK